MCFLTRAFSTRFKVEYARIVMEILFCLFLLQKQKQKVKKATGGETADEAVAAQTRRLKITRTFCDPEGRKFDRTEIVSRPALIDAYIRIRSKDDNFIKQFSALDSERKEILRKEKRRKQEQLRRSDAIQKRLEIDEAAQNGAWVC